MPAVNYPDLKSMFGEYSVGPTMEGYRRTQEASANNAFNLQQAVSEEQRTAEKHPFDLEASQQLARQRRLASDLAEKEQPTKLAEIGRKATEAADEDQAKGIERMGYAYQQIGAVARANGGKLPLALQGRVPPEVLQHLEQFGPDKMIEHGDAIIKHGKTYLGQAQKDEGKQQIEQLKAQVERYKADQRRAGQENAARLAAEARQRVAAAAAAGKKDVALKTLDQAYIHFSNLASTADDPEMRAFYTAQAQQMSDQKFSLVNAQASAKEAGKIDTGAASGMPVKNPPTAPTVAPPSKPSTTFRKNAKGEIELD